MSNCEIKIGKGAPVVTRYPKLMESILEYVEYDSTKAVDLYGLSLTDDYTKLVNNPNDLNSFLKYVQTKNIENTKKLSDKDQIYLNVLLNQPNSEIDFKSEYINTFSNNGLFEYNYHKILDSNLSVPFSETNKDSLENIFYYLFNNQSDLNTYNSPLILSESMNLDLNLFNLKLDFANILTREELIQKAVELENSDVLDNEDIQNWLLDFNKKKTFVPKMFVTDTLELQPVTNNVYNRISTTLDISQDFTSIKDSIEYITENLEELSITENLDDLERFLNVLERNLINKGFPVKGMSDNLLNSNIEDFQNFTGSLYNLLEDISTLNENSNDSLYEFTLEHQNLFKTESEPTLLEIDRLEDSEGVFHVKTNRSDSDMLSNFNLLSVGDNLYKIYTVLNVDYPSYYTPDMRGTFLDSFESGDNVDDVKVLSVIKSLEGVSFKDSEIDSRYNRVIDLNYEDFLTDFNKLLLKNPQLDELFSFTENGIEAKNQISDFSINLLTTFLNDNEMTMLQDYALISGNESLKSLLPNFTPLNEINDDIYRNYILNNPKNLLSLKSDYKKVDNTILAEGVLSNFIKVDGNIYERVIDNNFVRLEKSNNKVFNAKKPTIEVELESTISNKNVEIIKDKTKQKFC